MSHVLGDRVKEPTTTAGTGSISLGGAPVGYRAFSEVATNGQTVFYTIRHRTTGEWEVGKGTWQTGGILTRDTVYSSSNGGALTNFSAGIKDVWLDQPSTGGVISGNIASGQIGAMHLASGVIGTPTLASGIIRSGHIGDGAVVSGSIASGQIGASHLGSGAVLSGAIASGQIGPNHLGSGAVLSGAIASGQIGPNHLASGVVGVVNLASGQVRSGHIGNAAVVSGSIASGQIGRFHLNSGGVGSGWLGADAVQSGSIQINAVVSGNVAPETIGTNEIASGAVTSVKVMSGAVISGKLGTMPGLQPVVSGTIASGQIGPIHVISGFIIDQLALETSGAITSGKIGDYVVNVSNINSGAVTSDKLQGNAVVSGKIASNAVNTTNLASGATIDDARRLTSVAMMSPEIISGTRPVALNASGQLVLAMPDVAGRMPAIGLAYSGDPISGGIVSLIRVGNILTDANFSGSIGKEVWVGQSGTLTLTQPSAGARQVLGVATSNSGLLLLGGYNSGGPVLLSGSITSGMIADGAVVSGSIASGQIGINHLASGTITTSSVLSGGIVSGMIGNAAVVSGSIASGQVSKFHLAQGAAVSGVIPGATIGDALMSPADPLRQDKIGSGAITGSKLGDGAVISGKMLSGLAVDASRQLVEFLPAGETLVGPGAVTVNLSGQLLLAGPVLNRTNVYGVIEANASSGDLTRVVIGGRVEGFSFASGGTQAWVISGGVVTEVRGAVGAQPSNQVGLSMDGSGLQVQPINIPNSFIQPFALASGAAFANILSGSLTNIKIASGAIGSGHIGSGAIGQFHLSSGAVNSGQIGNAAVVSGSIASGSVGQVHLADGAVASGEIASGTISNFHVASGAILSGHVGNAAVVSGSIASGSIGQVHLADGAVASGEIASGSISRFHLASGAVNSGHIGDNAVVSGSIASGSIGRFHNSSGNVVSGAIGDGAVVSGSIASGSIGAVHLADGAVASGEIASGSVSRFHLASGAVNSGHIASGAIPILQDSQIVKYFTTIETVSGTRAVALDGTGKAWIAQSTISGRLPAIGVVAEGGGAVSGGIVTVVVCGPLQAASGLNNTRPGRPVFVNASGFIGNVSGGFLSGGVSAVGPISGTLTQLFGWATNSGGIMVAPQLVPPTQSGASFPNQVNPLSWL